MIVGSIDGTVDGTILGATVIIAIGNSVGLPTLGSSVGATVPAYTREGNRLGTEFIDGSSVGYVLGDSVGSFEGRKLPPLGIEGTLVGGSDIGCSVGDTLGASDGKEEVNKVGAAVDSCVAVGLMVKVSEGDIVGPVSENACEGEHEFVGASVETAWGT